MLVFFFQLQIQAVYVEIKFRCYAIDAVRVVVFQAGYIYRHIEGRQFIKLIKSLNATCSISYSWNSLYTARRRTMMVDTGATAKGGPVVDVSLEKDDSSGYASGGWKR